MTRQATNSLAKPDSDSSIKCTVSRQFTEYRDNQKHMPMGILILPPTDVPDVPQAQVHSFHQIRYRMALMIASYAWVGHMIINISLAQATGV